MTQKPQYQELEFDEDDAQNPQSCLQDGIIKPYKKFRSKHPTTKALLVWAIRFCLKIHGNWFWKEINIANLRSGITVALVSLPLSISLAVASDAEPLMGIISAVWGGLFGSIFISNQFNILGPTAALSGLLASAVTTFHHLPYILVILCFTSGIVMFFVWLFNWQRFVMFIPSSVLHGFTLGVAVIIILNQITSALGIILTVKHESVLVNAIQTMTQIKETNLWAFGIFSVFLICLLVLQSKISVIPWAIVFAIIGIIIGYLSQNQLIPVQVITLSEVYGQLPRRLWNYEFKDWSLEIILSGSGIASIISASFGIALIGILETLISARIVDNALKTTTGARRETFGLLMANLAAGCFGGVPVTAALARTSLNYKSYAKSRMSGIINAVTIAIVSAALLPYFAYIPLCVIAAILCMVAFRMVEYHELQEMAHLDRTMFILCLATAALCVILDTTMGILFGAVVALLLVTDAESIVTADYDIFNKFFSKVSQDVIDSLLVEKEEGDSPEAFPLLADDHGFGKGVAKEEHYTIVYRFVGSLTYVNILSHINHLKKLISGDAKFNILIIDIRRVNYIDFDGGVGLREIVDVYSKYGVQVIFTEAFGYVTRELDKYEFFAELKHQNRVCKTLEAATDLAQAIISKADPYSVELK